MVSRPASVLGWYASNYTYSADAPHAVTGLSSGETYTYDANGNPSTGSRQARPTSSGRRMITRVEGGLTYTQTFDAENRMISVTVGGQTTQFVYDGYGNLVKKIKPDGSSTIYVGRIYEVDKSAGGAVTRTVTYYPAGGALRIDGNVYYVLKDRLGSAYATTDASGNVVGEMRYYAFGETRLSTGNMFTDRLFTGQRWIAELGIYHFNARFYSPKLGRFLSADSIMSGMANPQGLNRFSYVANNPVRYTDPTGHMLAMDSGGGGGYTTSPITDYCSTHPSVCSGDHDDDGGGGGDPDDDGGGGGGVLPMPNPADDDGSYCSQAGGEVYCEIYIPSGALDPIDNLFAGAQVATWFIYPVIGVLVGAGIGGLPGAIIGGVIFAGAAKYESSVLESIQTEIHNAAESDNPLIVSTPADDNVGVVVSGTDDGSGTLVNTPMAFLTLNILVTIATGQTLVPSP